MRFELISFKLCPFVQRAVIVLRHKAIDHKVTFIELSDPPAWFREISPFGKVPLLRVDRDTVLFESSVIAEFLDEVTPGRLLPEDPLARAQARGWIEFGSACLWPLRDITTATTREEVAGVAGGLASKLDRLEGALTGAPYFLGPDFSLVDAAYAPLFHRLSYFEGLWPILDPARWPKLATWSNSLLTLPTVQGALVPDFTDLMNALVQRRQGYLASLLPAASRKASGSKQLY